MKVFRGLFGQGEGDRSQSRFNQMELSTETCLGDARLHAWHERFEAGNFESYREYLEFETDLVLRDATIYAAFETVPGRAAWVDEWVEQEPNNGLARAVRGQNLVQWAWDARTTARANQVSREQFEIFFERLGMAWEDFKAAWSLAPDDATAYIFAITASKGLQLGMDTGMELYQAVQERRPWSPWAHGSMIQLLAKKWSHSDTAMLEFARSVTREAPTGSPVHSVIPDAHVEQFFEVRDEAYWENSAVKAEIIEAAERSVDVATEDRSREMMMARSHFAYCFARVGDRARARREFDILGPVVTYPFLYHSDPMAASRAFRAWARGA